MILVHMVYKYHRQATFIDDISASKVREVMATEEKAQQIMRGQQRKGLSCLLVTCGAFDE